MQFSYRPEVDGLRSIAVCSVILNHLHDRLLPGGFLGVDIFFVISGYVITRSLLERNSRGLGDLVAGFYVRRVKRILPALIACVVVTAVLGALVINPQAPEYARSLKAGIFALFGASNIYFAKEATDYFGASAPLNLFTQTWSLGVEEQFYLVFPLLIWICGNQRRLLLTLLPLSVLSLSAFVLLNLKAQNSAYFMMPPRFWELSLGCAIALAPVGTIVPKGPGAAWPWIGGALLIMALWSPPSFQIATTMVAVIASGLLIVAVAPGHPVYMLLASRPMVAIGLLSYSLYLWHWSVLSLSRWTVGIDAWSTPFLVAAMFGVAGLSYVLVERPLRQANWSAVRSVTIGYGLGATACAALVVLVLRVGGGRLYTGVPVHMAAKGVETLLDGKRLDGTVQWSAHDCVLSSDTEVGKHIDLDRCAIGHDRHPPQGAPRFLVVGNSYSAAELEMYAVLADAGEGIVSLTSSWGASPTPSVPNDSAWSKANAYYWKTVVPDLIGQLHAGDVLVMVSDLSDLSPPAPTPESLKDIALLNRDVTELAQAVNPKGVKIIFQAGGPFLREAQCPPDSAVAQWFNPAGNLPCVYYSKQRTIDRLASLNNMLLEVERENENFFVFDVLAVLCPDDICRYQNARGTFLYRDVFSHPSLEGSALAQDAFLSTARRAISGLR
jgi:peptidoglycan/LPS O-acetylase OafA/YrhL